MNAGSGSRLSVMCASSTLLYVLSSLPLSVNSIALCAHTSSIRRSNSTLSGAAVHKSKRRAPAADFSLFNGPLTEANTEGNDKKGCSANEETGHNAADCIIQ